MARQVVSRSQRRMEKKQAMMLLVMVLAVSLVSFTLGVMVGRGGAGSEAVAEAPTTRLPVAKADAKADGESGQGGEKLTFYDSLPKGEPSPLGSGINLPPDDKKKAAAEEIDSVTEKAPAAETQVAAAAPAPAPAPEIPPAASAEGAYVVQVASFKGADDAAKLSDRLKGRDYAAFVEQADLKEKGLWHRVFVGPFADSETAAQVVARLDAEEKLSALVRKR